MMARARSDTGGRSTGALSRNDTTERFERFIARRPSSPHLRFFTRCSRNGRLRHFVQVPADDAPAFVRSFGARQHVVGFFAARHSTTDHVYLRLGNHVHDLKVYTDEEGEHWWTLNDGGRQRRFREGSSTITERLLQLTPGEFAALRRDVARLERRVRRGEGYVKRIRGDCISTWLLAPIGTRGRTLAEVVGIDNVVYVPAVMDGLLDEGNERVLGAAVYPARGREFTRFERTRERFLREGDPATALEIARRAAWVYPYE